MKEEDIDSRIERAVRNVASKKARMAEWDRERASESARKALRKRKLRVYGIPAAASVVVMLAVGTGLYLNHRGNGDMDVDVFAPSSVSTFRGGDVSLSDVESLMDSSRYEDAIKAIDEMLADTVVDKSLPAEQQEYIRSLNGVMRYDLTWLKISSLVGLGRTEEAISLLRIYVHEDGERQQEAEKLLKRLTE
ncbi:MAG: hypothetical protein K2L46_06865 [Paramuribaculum sp.]|nr:hypothetical protein [Paramuribaculum sp.]MDE6488985.1 hypothetical protein [Paramuribaculum sp.]